MSKVTFAPGVVIDGVTVYPPGWMYVMAFALRGVPWAVEKVESGEIDRVAKEWWAEREIEAARPWAGDGI